MPCESLHFREQEEGRCACHAYARCCSVLKGVGHLRVVHSNQVLYSNRNSQYNGCLGGLQESDANYTGPQELLGDELLSSIEGYKGLRTNVKRRSVAELHADEDSG